MFLVRVAGFHSILALFSHLWYNRTIKREKRSDPMKHFKRAAALMLTLCALLARTACGSLQDKV